MITDSQVSVPRPSALRRSEPQRAPLVGLITDHFVAKLVALLFAGVLVLLIDREVRETIVDGELFDVRIADPSQRTAASDQNVIILEKEPTVAIRSFQPNPVRVWIYGQHKLREQMKAGSLVGRVSVKKDWLRKDKDGIFSTTQAIDGSSVSFGLSGAEVRLEQPIKIDLDPEVTREVPLAAIPTDVGPGLVAEVEFQPLKAKVLGPSYYLGGAGSISHIQIPISCAGRNSDFTIPIATLPDDYLVQKQIRMTPGQQITATVRFSKGDQEPLDVKDVPFNFLMTPKASAEYIFATIGLAKEAVNVTVSGSPEAIALWRTQPEELKKRITVQIDVGKLVGKVAAQLTAPGAHTDEYAEVEVLQLPDNLKLVGVTPAQVDVTITKR